MFEQKNFSYDCSNLYNISVIEKEKLIHFSKGQYLRGKCE